MQTADALEKLAAETQCEAQIIIVIRAEEAFLEMQTANDAAHEAHSDGYPSESLAVTGTAVVAGSTAFYSVRSCLRLRLSTTR